MDEIVKSWFHFSTFQHYFILFSYFNDYFMLFALELEKNEINIFYSKNIIMQFPVFSSMHDTTTLRRKTMKVNKIDCISQTHTHTGREDMSQRKNFTQCLFKLTIFILNSLKCFVVVIVGTKINILF